jgi:hypothetical protein
MLRLLPSHFEVWSTVYCIPEGPVSRGLLHAEDADALARAALQRHNADAAAFARLFQEDGNIEAGSRVERALWDQQVHQLVT